MISDQVHTYYRRLLQSGPFYCCISNLRVISFALSTTTTPCPVPTSLYIVPCKHSLLLISYFYPLLRMPLIWLTFSTGKATTSKYKYSFRHHIFCVLPVSQHLITHCLQNVPRAHIISPNPNTHNYSSLFLWLLICFKLSFL